jgi:flavodoxin
MNRKILIAYYSQSGNTGKLANMIHTAVGGTLLDIGANGGVAVNFDTYDTVFVGTPNWSATVSAPVKDFLTASNLSGKTVVPFCTHGMGGLQNVAADIAKLCPASTVLPSFAIKGVEVDSAPDKVKTWLTEIGIL